ncbi:MAG: HAD family hydrolase [Caldilineaceae bacterium]|nr:HAD family hydrolase [Caldilineaceae bacterium]
MLTDFDLEAAARFFSPRVPLSVWEIFGRWQAWGEQWGFPRSTAEERALFEGFWDSLCDDLGLSQTTRSELQQFDYTTCLTVYPDVIPALQAAHAANLRVGVLSNFALASLEASLRATGLAAWIDVACAATVIGVSKPEPAAYAITAERLGVVPEQCLFFDDETACVAGAAAVGMQAYHVDRTLSAHDIAGRKVADLSGLVSLLDQIVLNQPS